MTDVDICNNALILFGASTINALDEDSTEARICSKVYSDARDTLLRMHPWNFAVKRKELTADTATPVFDYSKQFTLPSDCIRVLHLDDLEDDFKVEGSKILSDSSTINIKYISRVEDTSLMTAEFRNLLSIFIARKIAYRFSRNAKSISVLFEEFMLAFNEAKSADSQEGKPNPYVDNSWVESRY